MLKENSDCNGGVGVIAVSMGIPNGRCLDTRSAGEILLEEIKLLEHYKRTMI